MFLYFYHYFLLVRRNESGNRLQIDEKFFIVFRNIIVFLWDKKEET